MVDQIIFCIISSLIGLLFFFIGVYAIKLETPMAFYSGVEVKPTNIKDIKKYNKENGIMWMIYSLWYFISAIVIFINGIISMIFLILGCSLGIIILAFTYKHIYKKYKV